MSKLIKPRESNQKNIFESITIIEELQKDHYVVIDKPGTSIDKTLAHFNKKKQKGFTLNFDDPTHTHFNLSDIHNLNIQTSKHLLKVQKLLISSHNLQTVSASITNFQSENFRKKESYYFRLIIPLQNKVDFHFAIQRFHYETKRNRSSECIRISYSDMQVDLYQYVDRKKDLNYLIIDASEQTTLNSFSEYCFDTLVSFGYVTGSMPQNEGYFFAYNEDELKEPKHFYYSEMRNSIRSVYVPIYSNAYGYIHESKLAEKIQPSLRPMNLEEFSRLCQWCHSSMDFSSILLLIIEAASSSLLVMPSSLSVALEGITELIVKENETKVVPIKDKKLAQKIRKELKAIIDNYSEKLDAEGLQILKGKIEHINQPTNKSKLTKPFDLLKINLTETDLKTIEHRNDFLHGRINLTYGNDVDSANKEIFYVALSLYTLVAALILKSIGYDNKILNHPKIHEKVYNLTIDEEYYRQL